MIQKLYRKIYQTNYRKIYHWIFGATIRRQLIVGVALVHMLLMTVFVFDVVQRQKVFLLEKAQQSVLFQAELLAQTSLHTFISRDLQGMSEVLKTVAEDKSILDAMVTDVKGQVMGHTDFSNAGKYLSDEQSLQVLHNSSVAKVVTIGERRMTAIAPIQVQGRQLGWAWVSGDLSAARAHLGYVTRAGLIYTLIAILIGTLFAVLLSRAITLPLNLLIQGTERVSRNQFDEPIPVVTENEVGALTKAFNESMEKLGHKTREIIAAKDQAEESNRMKSSFLANMSHEIRTPLGAVLGFAELLKDPAVNADQKQNHFEIIARNGEALTRLIDDILDLSKIEAGHLPIEKSTIAFEPLVTEVLSSFARKAEVKGVRLVLRNESVVPRFVITDPFRLRQILTNIVGNAVKFTPAGEVQVILRSESTEDPKHKMISIAVRDSGLGISSDQVKRLFHPFSQVDNSMTRKFGGSGLGLALSQRLARALGGDVILVTSAPGEGSEFLIRVRAELPAHQEMLDPATLAMNSSSKSPLEFMGLRVLVVEDSLDNQKLIQIFLEKKGIEVEFANNGFEGLQKALDGDFWIGPHGHSDARNGWIYGNARAPKARCGDADNCTDGSCPEGRSGKMC